ncbi:hypothetical protein ACFYXM_18795 [Streptomyces sp. NPDC002476]|uniref:hypothetical protein n=1 Tax=Streptomyces sp. NPDC002476 TaxID=3364648 RepID=UPI0036966AED
MTPSAIAGCSALECLLTFVLLFGVTTVVRWVMGPSALSGAVPGVRLKLLIVGAAVGLLLVGLILSRPGRISGGHIDPALSLAMWRFGVFPGVKDERPRGTDRSDLTPGKKSPRSNKRVPHEINDLKRLHPTAVCTGFLPELGGAPFPFL